MSDRAILTIVKGPNSGDSSGIEKGHCRLAGRHLSEGETVMMDKHGNRMLGSTADLLENHLERQNPEGVKPAPEFSSSSFSRGPDVVIADDSISRAHAMIFFDDQGLGIIDLASTNGTFINGTRIASALVNNGDTIRIGSSEISVAY